jgi:hypothetical protein
MRLHMHTHMRVQVVTLVRTAADAYLLRLAHQFGLGEDPSLSLPATVGYRRGLAARAWDSALLRHHHLHHHHRSPHPPPPPLPPPPIPPPPLPPPPLRPPPLLPPPPAPPTFPPGRRRHTLCRRRAAGSREHRGALTHGQPAQGKCVSKCRVGGRSIAGMLSALAVAQNLPSTVPTHARTYLLFLLYLLYLSTYLPRPRCWRAAATARAGAYRASPRHPRHTRGARHRRCAGPSGAWSRSDHSRSRPSRS